MTRHDEHDVVLDTAAEPPHQPGRPVVLVPTPPGLWMVLLGVFVAMLAPLFGFLWGGTFGSGADDQVLSPIYIGLFVGVLVGAVGVVVALFGGVRLYRHNHAAGMAEDDAARQARKND